MIGDTGERDLVHATDPVVAHLDELQFTLADGPCLDACGSVAPVLVDDLRGGSSRTRWPVFAQEACAAGAVAVFAFPLVTGAVGFGVLELDRRHPRAAGGRCAADRRSGCGGVDESGADRAAQTRDRSGESEPVSIMQLILGGHPDKNESSQRSVDTRPLRC